MEFHGYRSGPIRYLGIKHFFKKGNERLPKIVVHAGHTRCEYICVCSHPEGHLRSWT
jgi:hypothetical protein